MVVCLDSYTIDIVKIELNQSYVNVSVDRDPNTNPAAVSQLVSVRQRMRRPLRLYLLMVLKEGYRQACQISGC